MAGQYAQLFRQSFTSTDTVTVNHGLGLYNLVVRLVVGETDRSDLIESVALDPGDPRNALTVNVVSVETGYVQIMSSDISAQSLLTPEVASTRALNRFDATTDPTVNDDEGDGYAVGSMWVNTTGDTVWVCTDATAGAASWKTSGGDLSGPGNSTDNALVRWDGTSGVLVQDSGILLSDTETMQAVDVASGAGNVFLIRAGNTASGAGGNLTLSPGTGTTADGVVVVNGIKHYASSATDPTSPSPAEGDRYYNTTLEMEMRYDGSRSKWLSVESTTLVFADEGNLPSGSYMNMGALRTSAARGYKAPFNGTVVGLSYTRDDSDAASFAVTSGGTTFSTVATSATSGRDNTLNDDFTQDAILAVRNDGANGIDDSHCVVRIKYRA
jgi:hypothetical protein